MTWRRIQETGRWRGRSVFLVMRAPMCWPIIRRSLRRRDCDRWRRSGLRVAPRLLSGGLDARPAIEKPISCATPRADCGSTRGVSLTGFSLVGGPAYNDTAAAEEALAALDVPYIAAHALEFQTIDEWRAGTRGLSPVEATMMVAIPEIDGATGPIVFGGRSGEDGADHRAMQVDGERADRLAGRVAKLVALRRRAIRWGPIAAPSAGLAATLSLSGCRPPARSISPTVQCPATYSGSVHSKNPTTGWAAYALTCSSSRKSRSRRAVTAARAASGRLTASPTRRWSSKHVLDCFRIERDHPRLGPHAERHVPDDAADGAQIDRADLADVLCEDDVRAKIGQFRRVERVQRAGPAELLPHGLVDIGGANPRRGVVVRSAGPVRTGRRSRLAAGAGAGRGGQGCCTRGCGRRACHPLRSERGSRSPPAVGLPHASLDASVSMDCLAAAGRWSGRAVQIGRFWSGPRIRIWSRGRIRRRYAG